MIIIILLVRTIIILVVMNNYSSSQSNTNDDDKNNNINTNNDNDISIINNFRWYVLRCGLTFYFLKSWVITLVGSKAILGYATYKAYG